MISEAEEKARAAVSHTTITPRILYFGTPVVLLSTENPDRRGHRGNATLGR